MNTLRPVLGSLKSASASAALYEASHVLVQEAVERLKKAIEAFVSDAGEDAVLSLFGERLYFQRAVRSHESLEFVDFIRLMEAKGIDSIGFSAPIRREDVADLVLFLAELGDPPVGGSVSLNQSPFTPIEDEPSHEVRMRARYLAAMDALRSALYSVQSGIRLDLTASTWAVQGLLETVVDDPAAALLLSTLKSHDQYTFYHSVNVAMLSAALARAGKVPDRMLEPLVLGALLHDIGKAKVGAETLNKPTKLSEAEWGEIVLHPQEGALAILGAAGPAQFLAGVVAFEHHAGFKRTGYPNYDDAPTPHPASRLVSVVDVYDAITTRRSYRRAETATRAQLVLRRGAGSEFDPDMVDLLHMVLTAYPVGSVVRLSGGETAIVIGTDVPGETLRCLVVKGRDGSFIDDPQQALVRVHHVADQVSPEVVDIQPSAYLAALG